MKLRGLLLGALAIAGLGSWGQGATAWLDDMPNFAYTGGPAMPRHRSGGQRAHRQWRKRRSSGRA